MTFDPDFMAHHSEFELLRGIPPEVQANAAALSASGQSRTAVHRPPDAYSKAPGPAPSAATQIPTQDPARHGLRRGDVTSFEAFSDGAQTIAGQQPEQINVQMSNPVDAMDPRPPTPASTPPAVPMGTDAPASVPRVAATAPVVPSTPPVAATAPVVPSTPPAPPLAVGPMPPAPIMTPSGAQSITSSLPTMDNVVAEGKQPQVISATPPPARTATG